MDCSMPGFPAHHQLLELAQTHVHQVSDAIQPSYPLSSPSPAPFNLSQHQGLFQWVSSSREVAKVLEHQHQSFQCIFRTDFILDWLAGSLEVQGTLKNLLQHHDSKSINSLVLNFLYGPTLTSYLTTGKNRALTRWTFVGKVMSLLFNMLSRFVIAFLPRSKRLLLSWLQSPSPVILKPKNKVWHCFHCLPIYFPWNDGTRCHDISFLTVEL